jgi:hypothetical protein
MAGALAVRTSADAKAIVAEILKDTTSGSQGFPSRGKGRRADVTKVLEQMVEEGILSRENIEGVLQATS